MILSKPFQKTTFYKFGTQKTYSRRIILNIFSENLVKNVLKFISYNFKDLCIYTFKTDL